MSIKTTTLKKAPSLGTVYQNLKQADPRLYDSLRGLDQKIKALVDNQIRAALSAPGIMGETLFIGYFNNGGNVLVINNEVNFVSPLDSYQYSQKEVVSYTWIPVTTRAPAAGFAQGQLDRPARKNTNSGPGAIYWWNFDIDDTGNVLTEVSYWDGATETITNDGLVEVYVNVKRTIQ